MKRGGQPSGVQIFYFGHLMGPRGSTGFSGVRVHVIAQGLDIFLSTKGASAFPFLPSNSIVDQFIKKKNLYNFIYIDFK